MAACYSELYEESEVEISTCNWLDSNYRIASLNIRYSTPMRGWIKEKYWMINNLSPRS